MLPVVKGSATDLATAMRSVKVSTGDASPGAMGGFLKFDFKDGSFSFGRDGDDVTGDRAIINVRSLSHGWKLWAGGKFTQTFVSIIDPLPTAPESVDGKFPSEARAFAGAFYDDGAPGEQFTFETNSYGGRKSVNDLIVKIMERANSNPAYMFPVVELHGQSYKNVKHGTTIFNPVFEVVAWANEDGAIEGMGRIEAKAEVEVEPEAPAPARRRRVVT